jgi:hypothetical protein
METIDYFDLLSDEVISHIAQFLDVVSLFRLSSTSRRLSVFKDISNTQWRKFYSERWHVEERELAVYSTIAWQDTYKTRIEAEKSYIRKIEAARATEQPKTEENEEKPDSITVSTTNPDTNKTETWFLPSVDPWYILLASEDFEAVDNAMGHLDLIFSPPFTSDDIKREVMARRFEILVTAFSKLAPKHPTLLNRLHIVETLLVSEAFRDYERPKGLIGFLASLLDVKTDITPLDTAAYCIWRAAQSSSGSINDFFNALEIVPKLIAVIEKCDDYAVVNSCIGALTWYKPKDNRVKYFQNGTFPKRIVELLRDVPKSTGLDYECVIKVLYKLAPENAKECLQEGVLEILFGIIRGAETQRKHISYALGALHNFSFFSDEVCSMISNDEAPLPMLLNLISTTTGDFEKEIIDSILYVLNDVALSETGVERLLELNALDHLLPLLNSANKSYYSSIYNVLNGSVDFSNMNGFLPDVMVKIAPYFQTLVDHWDLPESRASATNFWLTFTCATFPPREISKKLIEKVMKQLQVEKRLDFKRDIVMLLANIVEVDKLAFEGLNLTNLYKFLSDNLVTHDSEKEKVEMMKLELEKMNEQAALRRNNELFGEDSSNLMTDVGPTEISPVEVSNADVDMKDVSDQKQQKDDDEDSEEQDIEDTDMPWPLSLLAYLMQFEELRQLAIKDTKLLNKMLSLHRDKQQRVESQFLVVFFWTNLVNIPGWDTAEVFDCIEEFAMQAMWNMRWSFMFSYVEPYMHLFNKDNPAPLVILASWFLAHMSTTEPGRKGIQKLDPAAIKWMDSYQHSRVEFNMTQFHKNMQKRSRK